MIRVNWEINPNQDCSMNLAIVMTVSSHLDDAQTGVICLTVNKA